MRTTREWNSLEELSTPQLRDALFRILQETAISLQERALDEPEVLSVVPRLAAIVSGNEALADFREPLSALARSVGLWNYIDKTGADQRDRLIAEAASIPELDGIALHREQVEALNKLLSGRNLILSAPTSFGKSLLIDALLLSGKYKRVAIVLPTIALLDEFRRRLTSRFHEKFQIVMYNSEKPVGEHVIFLGTQERLINRLDLGSLDLAVVDEFYKLDPMRKDERSITLNAAVYHLLRRAKQFFFLGPNIDRVQISGDSPWRFEFLKTRFSTVAVDTFDLKNVANKFDRLQREAFNSKNWPALIFVSSPDKANKLAASLVDTKTLVGDGAGLSAWIEEYYGGKWELNEAVSAGIGVHHGRMPRALASRFVRLFNSGRLPLLICTSTLIEGVNTAAKSVMIYDKTINRDNFDFFTFSNIRGRAGRLGQHHIGQVFLFHEPPVDDLVDVTTPLFGDLDQAPDELVIHIDPEDSTPAISDRVQDLSTRLNLSLPELKRLSGVGLDTLEALSRAVSKAVRYSGSLAWSGRPDWQNLAAMCQVICTVRKAQTFGVGSANQLTMYLNKLRSAATMKQFFEWHSKTYLGDINKLDNVFKFLRACEYSLPELFAATEVFVLQNGVLADYSLLIAELPRWFRSEELKQLEEQGVPIQIAERFHRIGDTSAELRHRLMEMAARRDQRLSKLEIDWLTDALPG